VALTDVDPVGVTSGLAVLDGVVVGQLVLVDVAACVLVLAFAGAVAVSLVVSVVLSVAGAVVVPVAVAVSLGPVLSLAGLSLGLLLVLPVGGLVTVLVGAGVALGVADVAGLAAADDEEADAHAVAVPLLWPAEARSWLPPPDEPAWLPDPAAPGPLPLVLEEEIPTAEASWTKASRSGGNARTTPMANTAQAIARAGRSSPSRHSRGCLPGWPSAAGSSCPPGNMFQRRTRPARNPQRAQGAIESLLAWAGLDRTRARIRSSPSGRGSTWSAAACSSRRKNSAKSCPCGGMPSWPGLLITPAPGRRAGRSCRGLCGFSPRRG
jgi:hypothetical protein